MKRLSIIISVIILLSFSTSITCFAFEPSSNFICYINTFNIPENTAYIDMLIPMESNDENYTDYNTENGEKFSIKQNSEIVKYNDNSFASYTFHYKNSFSEIKPHYLVSFSCEDSVLEENKALFDKISNYHTEFSNYYIPITFDNTELEKNVDSVLRLLDKDIQYYKKETTVNFFDFQTSFYAFEEFQKQYKKIKFAYLSSDGDILGVSNEQNVENNLLSVFLGNPYLFLNLSGNTLSVSRTYGPPIGLAILIAIIVASVLITLLFIWIINSYQRRKDLFIRKLNS